MSGKDFQEEAVTAAARTLKSAELLSNSSNRTDLEAFDSNVRRPRPGPAVVDVGSAKSKTLAELFQQHHDRVFRTAYRVTGNIDDAEDVLQNVFVRVARSRETLLHVENTEAYFARAAINASLDLIRSRKRSNTFAVEDLATLKSASSFQSFQSPATEHEDRELRKLIREAVSKLGTTAAQMFVLRYFEGLGNAEIARTMNTSPLVVGVTLHRARARMRKEIGRYVRQGVGS